MKEIENAQTIIFTSKNFTPMETINFKYCTLTYYPEKLMVVYTALPNSGEQSDEDFKETTNQTNSLLEKYRPIRLLSDLSDFQFTVSIPLQIWSANESVPRVLKAGVKKSAIVIPNDLIVQLSIEQNADETPKNIADQYELEQRYFDDRQEAENWLMS